MDMWSQRGGRYKEDFDIRPFLYIYFFMVQVILTIIKKFFGEMIRIYVMI